MNITILATLCLISSGVCHDQTVTSSDFQPDLTMFDCYNQAKLAKWAASFPQYRVARVRCEIGRVKRGAV